MSEQRSSILLGAFLTSMIGGILLLLCDFAGWYNYGYYVRSWGWIGVSIDTPLSSMILIIVAICLFYCTYISYLGLRSGGKLNQQDIRKGLALAVFAFVIVAISGLIFSVEMLIEDPSEWWLDTGFYGGFFGSSLTALFFHLTSKSKV